MKMDLLTAMRTSQRENGSKISGPHLDNGKWYFWISSYGTIHNNFASLPDVEQWAKVLAGNTFFRTTDLERIRSQEQQQSKAAEWGASLMNGAKENESSENDDKKFW